MLRVTVWGYIQGFKFILFVYSNQKSQKKGKASKQNDHHRIPCALILRTLESLSRSRWLDSHTRAVFVEFTVYNANVNLFCVVTLLFETAAVGEIQTTVAIDDSKKKKRKLKMKWAMREETPATACLIYFYRSVPVCQRAAERSPLPVTRRPPHLCHCCRDHIFALYRLLHVPAGKWRIVASFCNSFNVQPAALTIPWFLWDHWEFFVYIFFFNAYRSSAGVDVCILNCQNCSECCLFWAERATFCQACFLA